MAGAGAQGNKEYLFAVALDSLRVTTMFGGSGGAVELRGWEERYFFLARLSLRAGHKEIVSSGGLIGLAMCFPKLRVLLGS